MHPALAADLFEPFELGERIDVVVDAQVEIGPFFLAMDQQRRGLFAALVAAGGFAGLHGHDQPLRKGQAGVGEYRPCAVSSSTAHPPACCRQWKSRCPGYARTSRRIRAGMGGDAAIGIHDMKLPALAAGVGCNQRRR